MLTKRFCPVIPRGILALLTAVASYQVMKQHPSEKQCGPHLEGRDFWVWVIYNGGSYFEKIWRTASYTLNLLSHGRWGCHGVGEGSHSTCRRMFHFIKWLPQVSLYRIPLTLVTGLTILPLFPSQWEHRPCITNVHTRISTLYGIHIFFVMCVLFYEVLFFC